MDRGYLDFARLYQLHQSKAYFVTRAKHNFAFKCRYSHKVGKTPGVQCDQTIMLGNLLFLSRVFKAITSDSLLRLISR